MNSKEALNELRKLNPQTTIQNTLLIERYLDLCKEIVGKDLEKLDILEEENKKLKEDRKDLLKEFNELEKVKEILQEYLKIKVFINNEGEYILDACDYAIPYLDKEEYDLLKEWL